MVETKKCSNCSCTNPNTASCCRKCGTRFPENTKPGNAKTCSITNFDIGRINHGQFIVRWSVVNAKRVFLNDSEVTGKTESIVPVKNIYPLTLRAENEFSFDTKQIALFHDIVHDTRTIYRDRIVEKKVLSYFTIS